MVILIEFTYRPIDTWPGDKPITGRPAPFTAHYGTTLDLLERELDHLGAKNVVLQVAVDERDIRLDGRPRARAVARHPGVVIAFDSKFGPLKYATGEFSTWQDNIRAIALSLEALRKVDRYGVSKRGEQYTGWKQLPPADGPTSREEAARLIISVGHPTASDPDYAIREILRADGPSRRMIRQALAKAHPDSGGDPETFRRVMKARELLEGGAS